MTKKTREFLVLGCVLAVVAAGIVGIALNAAANRAAARKAACDQTQVFNNNETVAQFKANCP